MLQLLQRRNQSEMYVEKRYVEMNLQMATRLAFSIGREERQLNLYWSRICLLVYRYELFCIAIGYL